MNIHNQSLLNSFKAYLRVEKGLTDNTIENYLSDLKFFFDEIDQNAEKVENIEIVEYFSSLRKLGISDSTIHRKRSSLKAFFGFIEEEDFQISLSLNDFPDLRYSQKLPDFLTQSETKKLLDSLEETDELTIRNKAIIETLYATGIRVSELVNLTIHDVSEEEEIVRVFGKGRKQRAVPISFPTIQLLNVYISKSRSKLKNPDSDDSLFLNRRGGKLSRMSIWNILRDAVIAAGISKRISPHTLRHSYATHLIENGANLRIVQLLLGHVSINSTQIYTNIDQRFIRENYKKYHPRAN
ncbi:MAG: tyrosine recombinase [Candidatus Cloacimonetes bacterium]|nr:tyrosine recombinase [Candidatus Cloacimonadota bacterium]